MAVDLEQPNGLFCELRVADALVELVQQGYALEGPEHGEHEEALRELLTDPAYSDYLDEALRRRAAQEWVARGTGEPEGVSVYFCNPDGLPLSSGDQSAVDELIAEVVATEHQKRRRVGALKRARVISALGRLEGVYIDSKRGKGGHLFVEYGDKQAVIQGNTRRDFDASRLHHFLSNLGIKIDDFLDVL